MTVFNSDSDNLLNCTLSKKSPSLHKHLIHLGISEHQEILLKNVSKNPFAIKIAKGVGFQLIHS